MINEREILNNLEKLLQNIVDSQEDLYKKYRNLEYMLIFIIFGICLGYIVGVLL
jgi:hypothetical protein